MNTKFILSTFIVVGLCIALMFFFPAFPPDESVKVEEYCTQYTAESCPADQCHACVLPPWQSMFTCHSQEYCAKSTDFDWMLERFPLPKL